MYHTMLVIKQQSILVIFAMGIMGVVSGLSFIWYRRKRLTCLQPSPNPVEPEVEPRVDKMENKKQCEFQNMSDDDDDVDKDEENLSGLLKIGENSKNCRNGDKGASCDDTFNDQKPVQKKSVTRSRRQLGVYVPPPARTTTPPKNLAGKQPHPPLPNLHAKKTPVYSLPSPTTPPERDSADKQSLPSMSPADISYIVTIKIPLWLVSRFIGKQGCGIKSLKQLSGAELKVLRSKATYCSHTSCNIIGSPKEIDTALNLISRRFPEVTLPNYPHMKLFYGSTCKPIPKQHSAYSEPMMLPPGVIPSTPFFASISHVDSLSSIWMHIVDQSQPCPWQELYNKINSTYTFASTCSWEYSEDDKSAVDIEKGQFYAVKTAKGDFARGLVKEIMPSTDSGDTTYTVLLVDYGNHINVTGDRLVPLRIIHMELPAQAVKVSLAGVELCPKSHIEEVRKMITDCVLEVHVCRETIPPEVELYKNGSKGTISSVCVAEELIKQGIVARQT